MSTSTSHPVHVMPKGPGVPYSNRIEIVDEQTAQHRGWRVDCGSCDLQFIGSTPEIAARGYAEHFVEAARADAAARTNPDAVEVKVCRHCSKPIVPTPDDLRRQSAWQHADGTGVGVGSVAAQWCETEEGYVKVEPSNGLAHFHEVGLACPACGHVEQPAPVETEHTFLVAVTASGINRHHAMDRIGARIESALSGLEWWVAEDDRMGAADQDSAVFVTPGKQHEAEEALVALGLTGTCNVVTRGESQFDGSPIGGTEKAPTHRLTRVPKSKSA